MTYRTLRKFEYTDNSKAYLDTMDKVAILMNKDFRNKIDLWYGKIRVESVKAGLDTVGYHYLIRRLEKADYPSSMNKWDKQTMTLFVKAKFYDNSLNLSGTDQYALILREYAESDLKEHYRVLKDQVIKSLSKQMYLLMMKAKIKMLQLTRQHCHKVLGNKECLWFKEDIVRAIGDKDFRVSYNKVNNLFASLLRKI